MNKYIKSVIIGAALLCAAVTSRAESLFEANEVGLNLGFNYSDAIIDQTFAPSVGVGYFFTKNLGVRGTTVLNVADVKAFNNAETVGIARLPLFKIVAPYVGAGASYNSTESQKWAPVILGGAELKVNRYWSLFAEGVHSFRNDNVNFNDWSFRGGIKVILF